MKVLVIPDVHLKPWMFQRASELMKEIKPDRAVCLMDIADDWRQQFNSIRILCGAMEIMMSVICGTRGRQAIPRSHRGQSVKSCGCCGNR